MKINAYNDKDLIYIALGDVNCSMENILKILEKFKSNVVVQAYYALSVICLLLCHPTRSSD